MMELTILMPCLNEVRTLPVCIDKAMAFLRRSGVQGEVVVSDNGSTDGSQEVARRHGARVVHAPVRGYGAALLAGIEAAQGRYVVMGDSDDSYDFSALDGFLERLRNGAQLVMGNRFAGGIADGAMPALHRYLGNPVLSFIGRLFFRTRIRDFHCGMRGFVRDDVRRLRLVTPGMEFASEMVAKAALAGLRIEEVPTTLRPDGRGRAPHLNTWRDGWRHLRFLLLFCPRWLFLYPGLLMIALGLAGFLVLVSGPLSFQKFGLDIHTLLFMAGASILGVQLVQLALLTRWVGVIAGVVPAPRWLERVQPLVSVEAGIFAGALLFLAGFAIAALLVADWRASGFGPLDPRASMRHAVPAITLMILGMQAAAGSMFAGALQLCWRSAATQRTAPGI